MPVAVTLNVAACPTLTVWFVGGMVICGALEPAAFTVRVAGLLVALPTELLTTTSNLLPVSEEAAGGVV